MFGRKNRSASKEEVAKRRRGQYVVVQRVPGVEPEVYAGPPHDFDAAIRVFDGVLESVPPGFFNPRSGASMRVVPLADWTKSRTAAALLES